MANELSHKILAVACAVCVLLGYANAYLVKWSVRHFQYCLWMVLKTNNPYEQTLTVELHIWSEEELLEE